MQITVVHKTIIYKKSTFEKFESNFLEFDASINLRNATLCSSFHMYLAPVYSMQENIIFSGNQLSTKVSSMKITYCG